MVRLLIVVACMSCTVSPVRRAWDAGIEEQQQQKYTAPRALVMEDVNLQEARFYSHRPEQRDVQDSLLLESFQVELFTSPGTLRTRIDVVIRNESTQQKQGRIRLPIPSNAAVTDAVLFVGDSARTGAFVSAARAKQVYQAIVSTKRDPLLALWDGPNWLDLSVFPIPGKGTRRFQVEWVEPTLLTAVPHKLPVLAHQGVVAGPIDEVKLNGTLVASSTGSILLPAETTQRVADKRTGEAFGHVLTVGHSLRPLAVVLVVDTSSSILPAARMQQRGAIERILAKLPKDSRVTLVAADWLVETIAQDQSPEQARAALTTLDQVISTGAFDLKNSFEIAGEKAREIDAHSIIYLGSGATHIGRGSVSDTVKMLQEAGISVYTSGAKVVSNLMMQVAWRTGGRHLRAMKQLPEILQRKQAEPVVEGVESWSQLHSVGASTYWLGRYLEDAPPGSSIAKSNDLAALWSRTQLAEQSGHSRVPVLSPSASILVLETDLDYKRWGIQDPKEDSSDWWLGLEGVEGGLWGTFDSSWGTIGAGASSAADTSLSGRGSAGYGRSYARGLNRGIPESVKIAEDTTRGMSEAVVRRHMRRKLPRIRHCYSKELLVTHLLGGMMTLQFSISSAGQVNDATASGMVAPVLESCVLLAIQSIQFPNPKDGEARAQYKFSFSPAYGNTETARMGRALQRFEGLDKSVRAAELSKEFGQRFESEEMLAWWLVQRFPSYTSRTSALLLATRLLHSAGKAREARRVLSLLVYGASAYAVELYKELGYGDDAQRMSEWLYTGWGN